MFIASAPVTSGFDYPRLYTKTLNLCIFPRISSFSVKILKHWKLVRNCFPWYSWSCYLWCILSTYLTSNERVLPGINFINVLREHFLYKILAPKIINLCFGFEIMAPKFCTKNERVKHWWNWLLYALECQ